MNKNNDFYKTNKNVKEHFSYTFSRKYIAPLIVPSAIKMGVSANMMSFIGLVVGIIGAACLAFSNPIFWIIGGTLLMLTLVLDVCDGAIARYHMSTDRRGAFTDIIAGKGIFIAILFYLIMKFSFLGNIFISIGIIAIVSSLINLALTEKELALGLREKHSAMAGEGRLLSAFNFFAVIIAVGIFDYIFQFSFGALMFYLGFSCLYILGFMITLKRFYK